MAKVKVLISSEKFLLPMKKTILNLHTLLLIVIISMLVSSCGIFDRTVEAPDVPENFEEFYLRFHHDPDFQMSRIDFPIEGKYMDGHTEYEWNEQNWEVLKVPVWDIDQPGIEIDYDQTDTSFFQKIWVENSGFLSEYRFELIQNKWYLVYALEQNL